jgi:PAS domain S-box-containing protein
MIDKEMVIIILDDEPAHAEAIFRSLKSSNLMKSIHIAYRLSEYHALVEKITPDIVIADINLPDGNAFSLLTGKNTNQSFPILIMTSYGDEESAVRAIKAGAIDYVVKSESTFAEMPHIVNRAFREWYNNELRQKAEYDLRVSEEKYRNLFQTMAQGVVYQEKNGRITAANPAAERILGLTLDQMQGRTSIAPDWRAIREGGLNYPGDEHPAMFALRTGKPVMNQLMGVFNPLKKTYVWIYVNAIPQFRPNEKTPYQVYTTFEDITDLKKTEEQLSSEKNRLAVTLKSIGDGVIATDICGTIIIMNKVAEELTGWNTNEALGKPITTIFTVIDDTTRKPCSNPIDIVLQTGNIAELNEHTILISRDGTERILSDSGAPIKDNSGNIIGVVLVFRDITEHHRLIESSQKNQKLESLGIMAGGIAHDFNNLLSGIYGYIDIAIELTQDENINDYLKRALDSIDRARNLTRQLLTFAKGGAPIKAVAKIDTVLQETVQFALSGSNINANYSIPVFLWPSDFDRNQICQVIDNIIINSMQAMLSGGTIDITAENLKLTDNAVGTLKCGNYIKISIKDQGIGISPEIIPRIFDPFFTTKKKGNGLGLATSYSIIKRHDGYIDVESELGKGTTFHIYLPALPDATPEIDVSLTTNHKGYGTILLMDDEEVIHGTLGEFLELFGYKVLHAYEGNQALQIVTEYTNKNNFLAAIILDLTVPGGLGGKDIIRSIRKIDPDIAVFVSSGYAEDPVIAHPKEYGFTASIGKPFRKSELEHTLSMYLKTQTVPL